MADETIIPATSTSAAVLAADIAAVTRGHGSAHIGYKPATGDAASVQSELDVLNANAGIYASVAALVTTMNGNLGAKTGEGTAFAQIAALTADVDTVESDIAAVVVDVDALEALVGAETGSGDVFTQLATLTARGGIISVPLLAPAGAATTYSGVLVAQRAIKITDGQINFVSYPTSTLGEYRFSVTNYDASADADDNLLSFPYFVISGTTAKHAYDIEFTTTDADLILAAGDYVYATIASTNADGVAGTGGILTLEFEYV